MCVRSVHKRERSLLPRSARHVSPVWLDECERARRLIAHDATSVALLDEMPTASVSTRASQSNLFLRSGTCVVCNAAQHAYITHCCRAWQCGQEATRGYTDIHSCASPLMCAHGVSV
jgi:hypothetical protein